MFADDYVGVSRPALLDSNMNSVGHRSLLMSLTGANLKHHGLNPTERY